MKAHTDAQFELFLSQLKTTNRTLDFYCDFEKIGQNTADVAISLNMLNFLLGKTDLRSAVEALWKRDPHVFEVLGILIAIRNTREERCLDSHGAIATLADLFSSVDGVMTFLQQTGLAQVFRKPEITNLVDYVFGVETGLDSNARKNRSGSITEKWVAAQFREAGLAFKQQVSSRTFPVIEQALGADQKVFDFAIRTAHATYLVEVNFYSGGGSKLNEVARAYTDLAPKINAIPGYEFVWVTDGVGWLQAKNKLQEAFSAIPSIYNFTTIGGFVARCKSGQ